MATANANSSVDGLTGGTFALALSLGAAGAGRQWATNAISFSADAARGWETDAGGSHVFCEKVSVDPPSSPVVHVNTPPPALLMPTSRPLRSSSAPPLLPPSPLPLAPLSYREVQIGRWQITAAFTRRFSTRTHQGALWRLPCQVFALMPYMFLFFRHLTGD